MADILLLEDRARVVEFTPPERPASATLVFRSPAGTSKATPSVTVDALARTVSAVDATTPEQVFTAATGTGTPVVGRSYWWVSSDDGAHEALVTLAELDASVWTLDGPVPGATKAQVGDLLKGARLTATIPDTATTTRGEDYSLEWTVTGADGVVRIYQQPAHVCRTLYRDPVSPTSAAEYVADAFPNHYVGRSWGYWRRLSARANARVWRRVRKDGRWPHLLGGDDAFVDAGEIALELELAKQNICSPSIVDIDAHKTALRDQLKEEVDDAISGQRYDEDDDGVTDPGEEGPISNFIAAVRR